MNKFHIFLGGLKDLGGSFEPVHDLSEPKPPSGRRDPDRKPRQYPLTTEFHTIDEKGQIRRKMPDGYPEEGE